MANNLRLVDTPAPANAPDRNMTALRALERKVLWLSSWMIHNANHIRESRDGLKVGGHQASSASVATMMTALLRFLTELLINSEFLTELCLCTEL